MKLTWSCTEPTKVDNKIEYAIYNDVNDTRVKCSSLGKMKEVKAAIKITLTRMNNGSGSYIKGLR